MTNIVKDVATLTTISEKTLMKLSKKALYSICEAVSEDKANDVAISELFIGIGTLYIKNDNGVMKYHFEPSDSLDKALTQTIVNNNNPLEGMLNDALHKKFADIYKDLC